MSQCAATGQLPEGTQWPLNRQGQRRESPQGGNVSLTGGHQWRDIGGEWPCLAADGHPGPHTSVRDDGTRVTWAAGEPQITVVEA